MTNEVLTPVTAATRLACVIGHPVAHSVSPQIHNAAFAACGVDARYVAFDIAPSLLADAVRGFRALGVLGVNVTVPHKQAVLDLVDDRTAEADLIGAGNTLYFDGDRLLADNTDATGLAPVLTGEVGLRRGDAVVLFGTGGAARAGAVALGRCGARVEVVGRRPEAVAAIEQLVADSGGVVAPAGDRPRLVVNSTPLGLDGELLPERLTALGPGQVALDMVYGPDDTPFLAAARRGGATVLDGLGMLVGQGAGSFTRWTGLPAPVTAMAAAGRVALGR